MCVECSGYRLFPQSAADLPLTHCNCIKLGGGCCASDVYGTNAQSAVQGWCNVDCPICYQNFGPGSPGTYTPATPNTPVSTSKTKYNTYCILAFYVCRNVYWIPAILSNYCRFATYGLRLY